MGRAAMGCAPTSVATRLHRSAGSDGSLGLHAEQRGWFAAMYGREMLYITQRRPGEAFGDECALRKDRDLNGCRRGRVPLLSVSDVGRGGPARVVGLRLNSVRWKGWSKSYTVW